MKGESPNRAVAPLAVAAAESVRASSATYVSSSGAAATGTVVVVVGAVVVLGLVGCVTVGECAGGLPDRSGPTAIRVTTAAATAATAMKTLRSTRRIVLLPARLRSSEGSTGGLGAAPELSISRMTVPTLSSSIGVVMAHHLPERSGPSG